MQEISKNQELSKPIIVLGMHRSGTSCVTGLLAMCGAGVGEQSELTAALPENPRGFFERRDFRNFCDYLLREFGADWWKIADFSIDQIPPGAQQKAREMISETVEKLQSQGTWVVKEPRLCLLFPVLRPLLRSPVCVHVYRDPLEVAKSLNERNGIAIQQGISLWEKYNHMIIRNSVDVPVIRISFDDLISQPHLCIENLVSSLQTEGVAGLEVPGESSILEFVDRNLRHHQTAPEATKGFLTPSQIELWSAMEAHGSLSPTDIPPLGSSTTSSLMDLEVATERTVSHEKELESVRLVAREGGLEHAKGEREQIEKERLAYLDRIEKQAGQISENRLEVQKLKEQKEKERLAYLDQIEKQAGQISENRLEVLILKEQVEKERLAYLDRIEKQAGQIRENRLEVLKLKKDIEVQGVVFETEMEQMVVAKNELNTQLRTQSLLKNKLDGDLDVLKRELSELKTELVWARQEESARTAEVVELVRVLDDKERRWEKFDVLISAIPLRVLASKFLRRLGNRLLAYRSRRSDASDARLLRKSQLFQSEFYLEKYPDVKQAGISPELHYVRHGALEGRIPGPDFDPEIYLELNSDVRMQGQNPLLHYLRHGIAEGRQLSRNQEASTEDI